MPISSFTGSILRALPSDGVTFTGAHPCLFLITCFQLLRERTEPNLCRNSIRTQRGRSSGWDSRALSRDSWVTGDLRAHSGYFVPVSQTVTRTTCWGDLGDTLRGERGERSSTAGQSPPTSRWLPLTALQKRHITKRNAAAGHCKSSVCRWMDRPADPETLSDAARATPEERPGTNSDIMFNLGFFFVLGISKVLWEFGTTLLES